MYHRPKGECVYSGKAKVPVIYVRPYLMLRRPDWMYFFSNKIILKIMCADHVMVWHTYPNLKYFCQHNMRSNRFGLICLCRLDSLPITQANMMLDLLCRQHWEIQLWSKNTATMFIDMNRTRIRKVMESNFKIVFLAVASFKNCFTKLINI